jgi:hypothetical protein
LTCNQTSHDNDVQHRDKIIDSESNREEDNLMKTIFRVKSIRFNEKIAHTLRQWLNSSRVEKKMLKLDTKLNILIFINTDWDKKFRRVESMWVDAQLQKCQQTISSRYCLDKNTKNFWDNFIKSIILIWSIRRHDQFEHQDVKLRKHVER